MTKRLICVSAVLLCLSSGAQAATLTFASGPGGPGELAVNLTSATNVTFDTGAIEGGDVVDFASTQPEDFANGDATISIHGNGTFPNLTVSVPSGFTFSDLDFRALFTGGTGGTITATDQNGSSVSTSIGPGAQELVLTSTGALTALTLSSPTGFSQLKQFEISGLTPLAQTPLPGAFALMGSVLLGFAGLGYMRLGNRPGDARAPGHRLGLA
jgi:hypothetical protein